MSNYYYNVPDDEVQAFQHKADFCSQEVEIIYMTKHQSKYVKLFVSKEKHLYTSYYIYRQVLFFPWYLRVLNRILYLII